MLNQVQHDNNGFQGFSHSWRILFIYTADSGFRLCRNLGLSYLCVCWCCLFLRFLRLARNDSSRFSSILLIMWCLELLFCKNYHFYDIISWYSGVVANLLKCGFVLWILLENHRWKALFIDNMTFLIDEQLKINFICLTHSNLANVYVLTVKSGFIACCIP